MQFLIIIFMTLIIKSCCLLKLKGKSEIEIFIILKNKSIFQ